MKDEMIKTGGDVAKGLIDKGGKMADKMLAKSGDFASGMMKLTSKLSDDVGMMADRILKMADKIGDMAERIERTEALMAKMTAAMADKDLDLAPFHSKGETTPATVLLDVDATEATEEKGPELVITGAPSSYLLYVSASPLFPDGETVISRIRGRDDYDASWSRSIAALKSVMNSADKKDTVIGVVSVAVKAGAENSRLTMLSNSVDITINK